MLHLGKKGGNGVELATKSNDSTIYRTSSVRAAPKLNAPCAALFSADNWTASTSRNRGMMLSNR
jgi:hypothetical protein